MLNHAVNPNPFPTPPPSPLPRPTFPPSPGPPPTPPPGIWSLAAAGESCDTHCNGMAITSECIPPRSDWLPGGKMTVWPTYEIGFDQIPVAKMCMGTKSGFGPPESPVLAGGKCYWKPTSDVPSCSTVPASSAMRFCPCEAKDSSDGAQRSIES